MEKKKHSIWIDTVEFPKFKKLENDLNVEVAVVGGGLAGMLIAYRLMKVGKKVVLFEKNRIGMGITKNTTAYITSQQDILYQDRLKQDGFYNTKRYLEANQMAIDEYERLSHEFSFDFERLPSYMYTSIDEKKVQKEVEILQNLGIDAKLKKEIGLPFDHLSAVEFPNQAQMNPLKLIDCLAKEVEIYENTNVDKIGGKYLIANGYKVQAEYIIIATHFPFINRLGLYYAKMYQKRSYVIAIKTDQKPKGLFTNLDEDKFYIRSYKDYLIIGGNDQRNGTSKEHFHTLRTFAEKYYPEAIITHEWANQDCITLDDKPYIGKYSGFRSNLYVATGFNLWGMTQAMISAILLTDLIIGKENKYEDLFNPNRNMIKQQLFVNLGIYIKHLFHPKKRKCTHLGSELIWNEDEKAWECPCHGSRYNEYGEVLDNPAIHHFKKEER